MKTRVYMADFGQRYAVVEGQHGCILLRMLSHQEYWDYYRGRLDELCVDDALVNWLPIFRAWSPEEAERYLSDIGVNCGAQMVFPCKPGEGSFTMTERNARVFAWARKEETSPIAAGWPSLI